jgi:hypothetical protein
MNVLHGFGYNTPADLLGNLIDRGTFRSRVEEYLEAFRRSSDNWYAKERAATDEVTAERKLAGWVAARGLNAYADSVEATAKGLMALAKLDDDRVEDDNLDEGDRNKADPPYVQVLAIDSHLSYSLPRASQHEGGVLLRAINPEIPGCGCVQPQGSEVFGRGGRLGLRSVGIALDQYLRRPVLLLFFPHPEYRSADFWLTRLGYAMVGVDLQGHDTGSTIDYRFVADPVDYTLGLVSGDEVIRGSSTSSGIDAALQFPGSSEYLACHLPNLGAYLENAAAKLDGQHIH